MAQGGPGRSRHRSRLRSVLWLAVIAAVVLLWLNTARRLELRPAARSPSASALALIDTQGIPIGLEDYRGKVVLLNLWATWCAPCRREIPLLARLHRELGPRGLVVLGINVEQPPPENLPAFAREWGIDYPILFPAGPLAGSFEPSGVIPHSWLIDRQGKVRASHAGLASASSLRVACLELLEESARSP